MASLARKVNIFSYPSLRAMSSFLFRDTLREVLSDRTSDNIGKTELIAHLDTSGLEWNSPRAEDKSRMYSLPASYLDLNTKLCGNSFDRSSVQIMHGLQAPNSQFPTEPASRDSSTSARFATCRSIPRIGSTRAVRRTCLRNS
jgi:hypothetical protein